MLRKIKKRRNPVKKLQTRAENLWKEAAHLRDGEGCQVQIHFPNLHVSHSEIYQIDHCIERGFKRLFLDIANATKICSFCNSNKRYNSAIRLAIEDIVKKREGIDTFERMREQRSMGGAFPEWSKVWYLEEQIGILEDIKETFSR